MQIRSSPYMIEIWRFVIITLHVISVDYADSGCPPDWFKLDNLCYTLAGQNSPMTWQGARQYCMDNSVGDGDLATIYTGGLQCEYDSN